MIAAGQQAFNAPTRGGSSRPGKCDLLFMCGFVVIVWLLVRVIKYIVTAHF